MRLRDHRSNGFPDPRSREPQAATLPIRPAPSPGKGGRSPEPGRPARSRCAESLGRIGSRPGPIVFGLIERMGQTDWGGERSGGNLVGRGGSRDTAGRGLAGHSPSAGIATRCRWGCRVRTLHERLGSDGARELPAASSPQRAPRPCRLQESAPVANGVPEFNFGANSCATVRCPGSGRGSNAHDGASLPTSPGGRNRGTVGR